MRKKAKSVDNQAFELGFALNRAPFNMLEETYKRRRQEGVLMKKIEREKVKMINCQERMSAAEEELREMRGEMLEES